MTARWARQSLSGTASGSLVTADATLASNWRRAIRSLTRPYPVSGPMIALMALAPLYIFIARSVSGRPLHAPELPVDGALPLLPAWALVYGALYFVLILLPVFIVRENVHVRRMFLAYLTVWLTAYVCFLLYPTAAPRAPKIVGGGFMAWGLRLLYSADPPYNCFPSLHVAHSVVSALMCHRVHRRVGLVAIACASLVALSTLFTKQHYVLDVIAGAFLGWLAYAILFRDVPRVKVPALDPELAPSFALATFALAGIGISCYWIAYRLGLG